MADTSPSTVSGGGPGRNGDTGRHGKAPVAECLALGDLVEQPLCHHPVVVVEPEPLAERGCHRHLGVGVRHNAVRVQRARNASAASPSAIPAMSTMRPILRRSRSDHSSTSFESTTQTMSHIAVAPSEIKKADDAPGPYTMANSGRDAAVTAMPPEAPDQRRRRHYQVWPSRLPKSDSGSSGRETRGMR